MGFEDFVSGVTSIFKSWKRKRPADEGEKSDTDTKRAKHNNNQRIHKYTITPDVREVSRKRTSYYVGEELPATESRHVEYKAGGVLFTRETLVQLVGKYACAFLNSEGGTLLAGVDDRGIVKGVSMSYEAWNDITCTIRDEIDKFRPPVRSHHYSMRQYPVISRDGGAGYNLSVVELKFNKGEEGQLYENGNHCVFLRRDGGVQGPLRPLEIKDLVIAKYSLLLKERKGAEMKKVEADAADAAKKRRLKEKNIQYITISP